jgi:hypothetical protein
MVFLERDQLTISQICTPICTITEKFIDHVDHVLEHQRIICLRTIIEVLISEVLSLITGEIKS